MANEVEQIVVGKIMVHASVKGSEKLDAFSGWMLTAFGAMLAFLLGKLTDLSPYITKETLPALVRLFLCALVVGVIAKFVATIAASLGAGAEAGESASKQAEGHFFDPVVFMAEFEKAAWGLNKWGVRWAVKRLRMGDFACSGRVANYVLQLQVVLSVLQSGFCMYAVWVLYKGLTI